MIETITLTGGLPRDAELRFVPNGSGVCEFTIAQSDRRLNQQTNQWEDSRNLYLDVTIWDETASDRRPNPVQWAHLASELSKGSQVAVVGKLHTKKWQDKQGNNRSKIEFLASKFYELPDTNSGAKQGAQAAGWNNAQPSAPQHQGATWGQPAQPANANAGDEIPF